jgi:hypothetical protein
LGLLLTLFQPEGADYAHYITASAPGFENLTTKALTTKEGPNICLGCSILPFSQLKKANIGMSQAKK